MRRWAILLGTAMLATALTVTPAAADEPSSFTGGATFVAPNVCDLPNFHEVTITWEGTAHEHGNVTVIRYTSWAESDAGFSGPGHETNVITNSDVWIDMVTFVQRNAETGELNTVKYRLAFANGEMRVDQFQQIRCVRDV